MRAAGMRACVLALAVSVCALPDVGSPPRRETERLGQQLTGHDFMGLPPTTGYEVGNFKGCPDCGWLSVPQPASPELVKHTSFPQLRKTGQPQT